MGSDHPGTPRFSEILGKLLRPGMVAGGVAVRKCNGCQALVSEGDQERHLCVADLIADEVRELRHAGKLAPRPAGTWVELIPGYASMAPSERQMARLAYCDRHDIESPHPDDRSLRTVADEIVGSRRA